VVTKVHHLAHKYSSGRLIMLGGGGYNYDATARIWTISIAEIAGIYDLEYETLHDPFSTKSSQFVMEKIRSTIDRIKKIHSFN